MTHSPLPPPVTRAMMRPREVRTKMLLLPVRCTCKKKNRSIHHLPTGVVVVELKPITATALMINDGRKKVVAGQRQHHHVIVCYNGIESPIVYGQFVITYVTIASHKVISLIYIKAYCIHTHVRKCLAINMAGPLVSNNLCIYL